jgi:cephalosporin hydroxylase
MEPRVLFGKYNVKLGRVLRRLAPARWHQSLPSPVLREALGQWATSASDMHDHLGTIFREAVAARPRLIVELGTRGGISTRALLAAAELTDAHVLSVDIADCSRIGLPERLRGRWSFVQSEDVAFANKPFAQFCAARGLPASAAVIFIDTSHEYAHTCAEIAAWMPRLTTPGVMLFHDTNMGMGWYRKLNGKVEPGGNRTRGVIHAIEEFLGRRYDERTFFADLVGGYLIHHVPWSSGLLVLWKLADDGAGGDS